MKKQFCVFLLAVCCVTGFFASAQTGPVRHKIALFAPLYLDSVFNGTTYKHGNTFPKFINPGLEFYQGAQMALDSLQKMGAPLDVFVFDSRAQNTSLNQRLNSPQMNGVELMIAHASAPEVKMLAGAAQYKKIPLISATLPNDAGVTNNPYLVVINSTLRTHVEGIYSYVQKHHPNAKITVFQKTGTQENQIRQYLQDFAKNNTTNPLKIEFKNIGNSFNTAALETSLDSNRTNVCIAGSLDENFGVNLVYQLQDIADTYPLTVIGMPTWETNREFEKPEFKDMEIVYSTPFNYMQPTTLSNKLANEFEAQTSGRPTDMFYRGYETTLRFALLLLDTGKDISSNLIRKGNYVFTAFDIQPVFLNNNNMTLDYFENKKLYYIKTFNGVKTIL